MAITKAKIKKWLSVKEKFSKYKVEENELRQEIATEILGDQLKGVKHQEMFGYKISPTAKLNQTLDEKALAAEWKSLSPEEKACIKFKPEVINKNLSKLPEDSILHKFITYKPGMPSLEIKELVAE